MLVAACRSSGDGPVDSDSGTGPAPTDTELVGDSAVDSASHAADTDTVPDGDVDTDVPAADTDADTDVLPADTDLDTDTGYHHRVDTDDTGFVRDTSLPPTATILTDTQSPTWAQVLSESGRCWTARYITGLMEITVVGMDTGTTHVLTQNIPVRRRWSPESLAWDDGWLYLPVQEGVVRVHPILHNVETVNTGPYQGFAASWTSGNFWLIGREPTAMPRDAIRATRFASFADLANDRPAERLDITNTQASRGSASSSGVWTAWHSDDHVIEQAPNGTERTVMLAGYHQWFHGFSVTDNGRIHVLNQGIPQEILVFDAATGARLADFPIKMRPPYWEVFYGLACEYH